MKFYQLPSSNIFPTVCYFSREKPLVKPTPSGVSHIFAFAIYFSFAFIFRSIEPKIKNTLLHFILFGVRSINLLQLSPVLVPISGAVTRKGLTTPLTRRVASGCYFVCMGYLRCVAWFSYWFDNLGFISKGNIYHRCAAHPFLFGEIPM